MIIGYTAGVFDLFHVGQVNLLRNAKKLCDRLVVGVSIDDLVFYKGKVPVIPFHERIEVVRSCQFVDVAIPQIDLDKSIAVAKLNAKHLFVGDDWYQTDSWKEQESKLEKLGCSVIYFPYTQGTSSTIINNTLNQLRLDSN